MNYAVLDFETASGKPGAICAVGIVAVWGQFAREFQTLINPQCDFDPFCQAVHGITKSMVRHAPTVREALEMMLPYLESGVVVAHNASFDIPQLSAALRENQMDYPALDVLCTLVLARRAFPGRESYKLGRLKDIFGFEFRAHDALEDARAAQGLFAKCAQRVGANSIDELLERLCVRKGRLANSQYASCRCTRKTPALARALQLEFTLAKEL